jgi:hypothetical protein
MLADRVEELRARAGPDRGARLSMYLDALAAAPNARSTLRWMATEPFGLLEDVVDGALELSHQGFDQRQGDQGEGSAVVYLRAALVAHGALPERDETIAGFDRWLDRTLAGLPDGPDRTAVTAFATWQVARRLAETTARHQGAPPESAVKRRSPCPRRAMDTGRRTDLRRLRRHQNRHWAQIRFGSRGGCASGDKHVADDDWADTCIRPSHVYPALTMSAWPPVSASDSGSPAFAGRCGGCFARRAPADRARRRSWT